MAAKRTKKKSASTTRKRSRKKAARRRESAAVEADPTVTRIQRVIELMVSTGAVEVEMEEAGSRLRVRLKEERPAVTYATAPLPSESAPVRSEAISAQDPGSAAPAAPTGEVFRSPMVGTFYRAPSPDAEPFVKIGDRIHFESPLCIIEAMKVMNEIKAEMEGEVVEILAQNGEPVDYGQPLFVIKV